MFALYTIANYQMINTPKLKAFSLQPMSQPAPKPYCISTYSFSLLSAFFHFIQAIIVLFLVFTNDKVQGRFGKVDVFVTLKEWNATLENQPPPTVLFAFNIPLAIATFFLLSCIFQLYATLRYVGNPLGNIRTRYLEYSLSASIMMVCIPLEVRIQEYYFLFTLFFSMFVTNILGYFADLAKTDLPDSDFYYYIHILSWMVCVTGYGSILATYASNVTSHKEIQPPWFVHVIVFVMAALFCGFGLVQTYDFSKRGNKYRLVDPDLFTKHLENVVFI